MDFRSLAVRESPMRSYGERPDRFSYRLDAGLMHQMLRRCDFPPNVELVRQRIRKYFEASKPDFLVTAAACGSDLLALDVAGELSVKRVVLLPTEPAVFRSSSVVDRPGNWGEMFDRLLKEVNVEILEVPEGQTGYLETNMRLLERAQTLASSNNTVARAFVVWDQKLRGPDDVTGHFLEQARLRRLPVIEISTL